MDYRRWEAEELLKGFKVGDDEDKLQLLLDKKFIDWKLHDWLFDAVLGLGKKEDDVSILQFPRFKTANDVERWCEKGIITREFADTFEYKYHMQPVY